MARRLFCLFKDSKDSKDSKEFKDFKDSKVVKVSKVAKVSKVVKVFKVFKVSKVKLWPLRLLRFLSLFFQAQLLMMSAISRASFCVVQREIGRLRRVSARCSVMESPPLGRRRGPDGVRIIPALSAQERSAR